MQAAGAAGRAPMKALNEIRTAILAAVMLALVAAGAGAQYPVPLHYDLRYENPAYVPSDIYREQPPPPPGQPDPYAFGAVQYGNLSLTGNLRLGRSFRGNVPYGQSGSQIGSNLPSMALSNFRRDSMGLEDVGTGVQYGVPTPYFPGSGSVTTPRVARDRFAVPPPSDRSPYTTANLNATSVGPLTQPMAPYYASTAGGAGGDYIVPEGASRAGYGLTIPRSALAWVDALIAGRVNAKPVPQAGENQEQKDPRVGLLPRPADRRIGAKATDLPETEPTLVKPTREQEFEESQSALSWQVRQEAARKRQGQPEAETAVVPLKKREWPAAPGEEVGPTPGQDKEQSPGLPPVAERFVAPGGYADYVERAAAAMKGTDFGQAEALYAAARALEPSRPGAFFGRLHALLGGMHYGQAALVADRDLRAHPEWVTAVPDITSAYSKPEIVDRIVTDLRTQIKSKPSDVPSAFLLGYVFYAAGRNDDARLYLTAVAQTREKEQGPEQAILKAIEARTGKK